MHCPLTLLGRNSDTYVTLDGSRIHKTMYLHRAEVSVLLQHKGQTVKPETIGIQGKLIYWLTDHMNDRVLKVVMNDICPGTKSINIPIHFSNR